MPYNGVTFRTISLPQNQLNVDVPEFWSDAAGFVFADRCLTPVPIPATLEAVEEADVPDWLWRHVPAANRGETSFCRENSARAVIDRVAGGKTYLGWKAGYFEAESDARAFFDELRWVLCHQLAAPEITQWRHGGVYWAYGITTAADDSYLVDYKTGNVRRAAGGEVPPHGAYINGVSGPAEGEGGAWDLWRRESRQLAERCSTGVNISDMSPGMPQGPSHLAEMLVIGDAGAGLAEHPPGQRRRVTIDGNHPDCTAILETRMHPRDRAAATRIGHQIADRHLRAIAEAARLSAPGHRKPSLTSPALRLAIQSARGVDVPEEMIGRAIRLGRDKDGRWPACVPATGATSPAAVTAIRIANRDVEHIAADRVDPAPFTQPAALAWYAGDCALHFSDAADALNSCAKSGAIRSANGMGDYLFLDDTACSRGVINAAAFVDSQGHADLDGVRHTTALMTILLDLTHLETGHPTPRLGRRSWDFRSVGLSPTGTGEMLMRLGVAYDSDDGRAICGALCGILSATAVAVSARLSEELGAFPEYGRNTEPLARVMESCVRTARAKTIGMMSTVSANWASTCRDAWVDAAGLAARHGVRNAVVTLI